ncbi:GNAT family N-acetyltransferase [Tepidibacter aestuarii]|uniref:GNAT family N-acetyltransferase n=1 Tax=Tepidibacter aestuarii TaxID=2925782 RepID=UPI0020BF0139|nr:GNAT family N-acetyltransferase [Tepidibacter aestuarii]CAH2213497.1 N-acetyltransferase domain-containing protein [Tepidibacter aestuarii]
MVEFYDISFDKIGVIKNLWEENRQYHENTSEYFKELYHSISFDQRVKAFSILPNDMLKITVSKKEDEYIGYCISTINGSKGEVESLHVNADSRRNGIGQELMNRHIEWIREKGCIVIGVTVSQENKSTISFYEKLGFYPNTLYMQLK